ncbi:GHMP kinase [Candidatus Chloroploca sp. M-50]|uniref:GHMP kinase n=1 Tax=Candidatus Chloroploca mongolica TaxID=2528176 RepID=A0ABS4DHS4_9CHLR|nr:GHMP kinase [Candidatus Chloroploca mongolica]MBP1468990.1 GHMP kinase [Candidatus Chloroploca mongolica]
MRHTTIPDGFAELVPAMAVSYRQILHALTDHGVVVAPYPRQLPPTNLHGIAAARAYPMQGVLKYHGLADWQQRIAFLPSISVNNDAAQTVTIVEFDPSLEADTALFGDAPAVGRELERISQILDAVRSLAGVRVAARVTTRNLLKSRVAGKGLGTSAAGAAALAAAAVGALFGPELVANTRFLSCLARLLAGSGCRAAAGGLALWLSYPGLAHEDSFAVRLDGEDQLADVRLITVPIDSRVGLKTEQAHHDAPQSSFFKAWMLSRGDEISECLAAVRRGDWRVVGQFAELDSMRLHGVTMSGSREHKLIGWEPENITLFRMCDDLRTRGIPVYASTDTGPTVVLLTHRDHEDAVVAAVEGLGLGLETVRGRIAGPASLLDLDEARALLR